MELSGAKILMTGGAGFIGSHFVADLLDAGASVTVYDNFSTGLTENLEGLAVDIVEGDILDYDSLRRAVAGHDAISHQAAQLEITRSIGDPIYDLTTNTIGTLNVLKAAKETGIAKRASSGFLLVSSASLPRASSLRQKLMTILNLHAADLRTVLR